MVELKWRLPTKSVSKSRSTAGSRQFDKQASRHRSYAALLRGKATEEPPFHHFHRHQVGEQHGDQGLEKECRWRNKTETRTERCERQQCGHRHNRQRTGYQPGVGPALEGVLAGADDKDHQHLRRHRLDEPAGRPTHLCSGSNHA